MTDTLRERVVAEMMASVGCERLDNTEWRAYCLMADAAIAIIRAEVLEEAARELDGWGDIYGDNAAAACRALKEQA